MLVAPTDMPTALRDVGSWGQGRKHMLALNLSGLNPERTSRGMSPWRGQIAHNPQGCARLARPTAFRRQQDVQGDLL
jgi:hypothetical protein